MKVSILAQEYNIGNSTLYDIKKQSKELKANASAEKTMKGCDKQRTLRKPALETLDEALYDWFKDKHSEGRPIPRISQFSLLLRERLHAAVVLNAYNIANPIEDSLMAAFG